MDNTVQGRHDFWGEHGLAFWVETESGPVLYDTGQSGTVLLHNLEAAHLDPRGLRAIVLSHSHYDHSGGLQALLERTGRLPIYMHPDWFRERFTQRKGELKKVGPPLTRSELELHADLCLSADSQLVACDVRTTGEIRLRQELEGRGPNHLTRDERGLIPDPYRDDLSLVLETEKGLVLLCGCCHAGLLNTLAHVQAHFRGEILAVIGGLHLGDYKEAQIEHVIERLRNYGAMRIYPNHCTGSRAFLMLTIAFGQRVMPFTAGDELSV